MIDEIRSRQAFEDLPEHELYSLLTSCQRRYKQKLQDSTYLQSLSAWMFACANAGKDSKPRIEDYQPFADQKKGRADRVALSLIAEHWEIVPGWVREMLATTGITVAKDLWDKLERSPSRMIGSIHCFGIDGRIVDGLPTFQMFVINPERDDFPQTVTLYPLEGGDDPAMQLDGSVLEQMSFDGEIVSYGKIDKQPSNR